MVMTMMVTVSTGSLWACSCAGPGEPCHATARSAAVFTGKVLRVDAWDERVARLQILDVLTGIPSAQSEVDVATGWGGGDCGFPFLPDMEYVVYAYRDANSGRLSTNICSRTRLLDAGAAEDLAYFQKMKQAPALSELRVRTGTFNRSGPRGVDVIAVGPDGAEHRGTTNNVGIAEFTQLPPGKYAVRRVDSGGGSVLVEVHAKGCGDVTLHQMLQLSGHVTMADGKPAPLLQLELRQDDGRGGSTRYDTAWTDLLGRFTFSIGNAGEFRLGVAGRDWFHPGTGSTSDATVIRFSGGKAEMRTYDLVLPPHAESWLLRDRNR
jgi:hypothetical protein